MFLWFILIITFYCKGDRESSSSKWLTIIFLENILIKIFLNQSKKGKTNTNHVLKKIHNLILICTYGGEYYSFSFTFVALLIYLDGIYGNQVTFVHGLQRSGPPQTYQIRHDPRRVNIIGGKASSMWVLEGALGGALSLPPRRS